jgi:AcrR family transcriptional regulator
MDPPAAAERLLTAAKSLFARHGYEQTSTAAIARQAGTSESQLMRHFGGKRGLLVAIFDRGWQELNRPPSRTESSDPRKAIESLLKQVMGSFERDQELAFLLLFEGRRIREGGQDFQLSVGYREFVRRFEGLIRVGQRSGILSARVSAAALSAALLGAAEGMMRERLIAVREGRPARFSSQQVRRLFHLLLSGATAEQSIRVRR